MKKDDFNQSNKNKNKKKNEYSFLFEEQQQNDSDDWGNYVNNLSFKKNQEKVFLYEPRNNTTLNSNKDSSSYFGIEELDNSGEDEEDEDEEEKIYSKKVLKRENLMIRVILLKSVNGYHLIRFYKKSGEFLDFYDKMQKIIEIIKKSLNID